MAEKTREVRDLVAADQRTWTDTLAERDIQVGTMLDVQIERETLAHPDLVKTAMEELEE